MVTIIKFGREFWECLVHHKSTHLLEASKYVYDHTAQLKNINLSTSIGEGSPLPN